jgi:hypothetical protein
LIVWGGEENRVECAFVRYVPFSKRKGSVMAFKMPKETKPVLLGAVAGALLISWAGFELAGWKTSSAAATLVKRQSEAAVAAALAPICAAKFKAGPNLPTRLEALQKTDRWSRGGVLTKEGWATMEGAKEPLSGVAEACAEVLVPEKQ